MNNIKFIYFDLGGVVINDFSGTNKWNEMYGSMGINDSNRDKYNTIWNKYKDRICIDYDIDLMIDELREFVGLKLDNNFSFLDEFIKKFDPNPSIWPTIKYASKKYKIGLLTNVYPRMLNKVFGKPNLMPNVTWDVIVDSSVEKQRKPNPEIYELAFKLSGVTNPSEILFIDNSEENLTYPKQRGWQTFLYDNTQITSLEKLIRSNN